MRHEAALDVASSSLDPRGTNPKGMSTRLLHGTVDLGMALSRLYKGIGVPVSSDREQHHSHQYNFLAINVSSNPQLQIK